MSNKKTFLTTAAFISAGTLMLAQDTAWPGLGTVMTDYANRAGNVYYAAQADNWGLAAYEIKEMTEIQEVAEKNRPARANALKSFEKGALVPLAKDILNQDSAAFHKDFDKMTALCNGCHQSSGFGFIVYKLPDRAAVPAKMDVGMKFTRSQLQSLLGDVLK